jgi:hypothetical protein
MSMTEIRKTMKAIESTDITFSQLLVEKKIDDDEEHVPCYDYDMQTIEEDAMHWNAEEEVKSACQPYEMNTLTEKKAE